MDVSRARSGRILRFGGLAIAMVVLLAIGIVVASGSPRRQSLQPSAAQISLVMWRTVLAQEPMEHFYPAGQLTMNSDGSTGNFTAEVGAVMPSTDGDGQLVFFWHDNSFVGWDSIVDSMDVLDLQALRGGQFRVTYSNYAPNDPACCPSLVPISVVYRWNGYRFLVRGAPPMIRPIPSLVRLIR